eukprot:gene39040-48215_t
MPRPWLADTGTNAYVLMPRHRPYALTLTPSAPRSAAMGNDTQRYIAT